MAMAHWVSRIAYVAAKLGLADHLASGPALTTLQNLLLGGFAGWQSHTHFFANF
jgi:hypothetical protein